MFRLVQLSLATVVLTFFALLPIIIDHEARLNKAMFLVLMWFPFAITGWNLFVNYLHAAVNNNPKDDEKITIVGAIISMFLFVTSWALIFMPFWLYDPDHSWEVIHDVHNTLEMWISFVGVSLAIACGGGYMVHAPESWLAQLVASHLGYTAYIFIIFGMSAVSLVVWERTKRNRALCPSKPKHCGYMDLFTIFFRGPIGTIFFVLFNTCITIFALVILMLDKDSVLHQIMFFSIFWIPYAFTLWNLIVNYMFVLFNNDPNDDETISIPAAIVSYLSHAYSWGLIYLPFWLYDPLNSWTHLDPTFNVLTAWSHFTFTSVSVACGGEFMFQRPASWLAQIVSGLLIYISFPFLAIGFVSIIGMIWELAKEKREKKRLY